MKNVEACERLKAEILEDFTFHDNVSRAVLDNCIIAAYDVMVSAQEALDRDGLTVAGDRGGVKAHPAAAILRDARQQFFAGIKLLKLHEDEDETRPVGRPSAYDTWRKRGTI